MSRIGVSRSKVGMESTSFLELSLSLALYSQAEVYVLFRGQFATFNFLGF